MTTTAVRAERRVALPAEIERAIELVRSGKEDQAEEIVWTQTAAIRKRVIARWMLSAKLAGLTPDDLESLCWQPVRTIFRRFCAADGGPACSWEAAAARTINRDLEREIARIRGDRRLEWAKSRAVGEKSAWADEALLDFNDLKVEPSISWEDELIDDAHRASALQRLAEQAGVSEEDLHALLAQEGLDNRRRQRLIVRLRKAAYLWDATALEPIVFAKAPTEDGPPVVSVPLFQVPEAAAHETQERRCRAHRPSPQEIEVALATVMEPLFAEAA